MAYMYMLIIIYYLFGLKNYRYNIIIIKVMTMTIKNSVLECELSYIFDDNNEPWFNGKYVGIALGYKDTKKA